MKKCGLSEEINQCQFFDKKNKICINPEKCSFQDFDIDNSGGNKYVREERWYEKYYKGSRRL